MKSFRRLGALVAVMSAAFTLLIASPAHAKTWYVYQVFRTIDQCDAIGEFLEDTGYVPNQDHWTCSWDSPGWALWIYR
jgi:hypothetical protein